jgi:hypothetical protein
MRVSQIFHRSRRGCSTVFAEPIDFKNAGAAGLTVCHRALPDLPWVTTAGRVLFELKEFDGA